MLQPGQAAQQSPEHRQCAADPYSNLYMQVWGQKQIWLIDPSQTDQVKPFKTPLVLRNTSTTDISDITSRGGVTAWQCNLQVMPSDSAVFPSLKCCW